MRKLLLFAAMVPGAALFFTGCETVPPGVERGPDGTIAYEVLIEASEPGARIEANQQTIGNTPVKLKIFGDKDGTFHDFGSFEYVIQAFPLVTNQFVQTRVYHTGRLFTPEDHIPQHIQFDMNQNTPVYPGSYSAEGGPSPYYGAPYPYPYYPYPYYYGAPYYYGPRLHFYYGGGHHYYGHHR
jgi:hypothetical protein